MSILEAIEKDAANRDHGFTSEKEQKRRTNLIGAIIQNICELPDRTSPDDEPDLLLVTIPELDLILRRHLFGEE